MVHAWVPCICYKKKHCINTLTFAHSSGTEIRWKASCNKKNLTIANESCISYAHKVTSSSCSSHLSFNFSTRCVMMSKLFVVTVEKCETYILQLYSVPPYGSSCWNFKRVFNSRRAGMIGLRCADNMLSRFDTKPECDRQTDRHNCYISVGRQHCCAQCWRWIKIYDVCVVVDCNIDVFVVLL